MRIQACELSVGDVLLLNDWHLHVTRVERDRSTAVLTAEFDFLLHFTQDAFVTVEVHALAA
jgi:hypothetical protein